MSMNPQQLKNLLEAAMLAAGQPLPLEKMQGLFPEGEGPSKEELRDALTELAADCAQRGVELKEVGSGFRLQVRSDFAPWVSRLWEERPQRYSRAIMETLALIAYRQPITRAEIEEIRGVAVSSHIVKALQEREWIRIVGHREVPGRPALFGTTRLFLDYFGLSSLEELPPLSELRNLDEVAAQLDATAEAVLAEAAAGDSEFAPEQDAVPTAAHTPELEDVVAAVADAHVIEDESAIGLASDAIAVVVSEIEAAEAAETELAASDVTDADKNETAAIVASQTAIFKKLRGTGATESATADAEVVPSNSDEATVPPLTANG